MGSLITWLLTHRKIVVKAILGLAVAFILSWCISLRDQNKMLSTRLETAQNNIEAYQGSLQGFQQANNVLVLNMQELQQQNDKLIKQIDSVRGVLNINSKNISTVATQTHQILVSSNKPTEKELIEVLKDTTYSDSIQYNDQTKVYYTISNDTVGVSLKINNTQYLFIYSEKEYKNKKNFLQRLFTLDFKKIKKVKYKIENTNPLLQESDVRIIEQEK